MSNVLSKLTNLSSKLTGTTTGGGQLGFFNLKLPASLYSLNKTETVTTVGGLANKLTSYIGDFNQIKNTALCLIMSPESLLGAMGKVLTQIGIYAAQMALKFAEMFGNQIRQLMSQVLGTALNLVNGIFGVVNALVGIAASIYSIYETIKNMKWEDSKWEIDKEKCEDLFAAIMACYLNKFFGGKLKKFEQKISNKINQVGANVNEKLADSLKDVNAVGNYMNQEAFMLNKANIQFKELGGMVKGINQNRV